MCSIDTELQSVTSFEEMLKQAKFDIQHYNVKFFVFNTSKMNSSSSFVLLVAISKIIVPKL